MIAKIKNIFLVYSLLFLIGAITCFTAFNWKLMNNFQKLGVPSVLLVAGFIVYMYFKKKIYKNLSLFFSCFMIGTLFATFGQIYQTGADSYTLFRAWAIFLILPTILTLSYSLFSLLITVSSLGIYFYSTIFYPRAEGTFLAMLIIGLIILLYPLLNKKYKLEFNNLFYYSLIIPFYILFNFSGVISYFSNIWTEQGRIVLPITMVIRILYPIILTLIYFVSVKIYKKIIILPFSIISGGLFIWALFMKATAFSNSYIDGTFYFLVSTIIFIATLTILIKNTPKIDNQFTKKIFTYIANILKLFSFICAIGFFLLLSVLSGFGLFMFLFVGIACIVLSFLLPKILNFNEKDKIEIFTFVLGLGFCNYFLIENLGRTYIEEHIILISTINLIIYNIVLFFRPSRIMTLFLLPTHYFYIFIVLVDLLPIYSDKIYMNLIFVLGLLVILSQLILEKQNQNTNKNNLLGDNSTALPSQMLGDLAASKNALSPYGTRASKTDCQVAASQEKRIFTFVNKYKKQLNLIFYGNNIALIFISYIVLPSYFFNEFNEREYLGYGKLNFILYNFKEFIILILSIIVIIFMFKDKLKNKDLKSEIIKNIIILSVIISIIEFFAPYIMLSRYLIFLILFYAYKKNKWTVGLLNILLCYQIFSYYYYDIYTTLLTKSFNMFRIYGLLLFAYLVIKFFVKEFEKGVE